ncbi:MAG: DUF1732 domain-containing protein [Simkania negevensis]|nr:DUF1732 domain-containing protein [Simkania negevensis]
MLRSMTAYGKAECRTKQALYTIEIHSVNRKHLDIAIQLPPELLFLDIDLRKRLGVDVVRGKLSVKVGKEKFKGKGALVEPSSLRKLYKECETLAESLKYKSRGDIPFSFLLELALSGKQSEELLDPEARENLFKGFEAALQDFVKMKELEGEILLEDFRQRVKEIELHLKVIETRAKEAPNRYLEKLKKRLEDLRLIHGGDEDRLIRELVFFSDRIDVTEELLRLRSHLLQFQQTLLSKESASGRKLDFLLQEMHREIGTILAKKFFIFSKYTLFPQ